MVAYNIYSFFPPLSRPGFAVLLSRMISEADTLDRPPVQRIFRTAAGTRGHRRVLPLLMLLFNRQLAVMMGNADAAPSILALAPAVVIVCLTSAYRTAVRTRTQSSVRTGDPGSRQTRRRPDARLPSHPRAQAPALARQ